MEEEILRERLLWVYEKLLYKLNNSNQPAIERARQAVEIKEAIIAVKTVTAFELKIIAKMPQIMQALAVIEESETTFKVPEKQ